MPVKGIITHPRPHLDEILAMFLLSLFGEEKYPGVRDAIANKRIFAVRVEDLNATAEEYEQDGYILLGLGGGKYDEHGTNGDGRKQGDCCATLVAKDLGVDGLQELAKILKFVTQSDLNANSQPFDIATMVILINAQYPNNPSFAIDFAFTALSAKYAEQYDFFVVAPADFKKATIQEIEIAGGKKLRMVTVVSDSEAIGKYIRSPEHGGGADIIIQKNSRGQVQIFTDKRANLDMTDTAQILRFVEQEANGQITTTDWKLLAGEGKVDGCEEWYFFPKGAMLLNGSLTAPNTSPTKIPLEGIQKLVQIGVSGNFEPSREQKCLQGVCTSSRSNECPWYPFGLKRCRQIRFAQHQRSA